MIPRQAYFCTTMVLWLAATAGLRAGALFVISPILGPLPSYMSTILLVGCAGGAIALFGILERHARAMGAFESAREHAIIAPWTGPPEVEGPWDELPLLPPAVQPMEVPKPIKTSVRARDAHGAILIEERNDFGLCLVRLVGVAVSKSRWLYMPMATEELHRLEDGRITLHGIVMTREVLIVDMTHDGARIGAWKVAGSELPPGYIDVEEQH